MSLPREQHILIVAEQLFIFHAPVALHQMRFQCFTMFVNYLVCLNCWLRWPFFPLHSRFSLIVPQDDSKRISQRYLPKHVPLSRTVHNKAGVIWSRLLSHRLNGEWIFWIKKKNASFRLRRCDFKTQRARPTQNSLLNVCVSYPFFPSLGIRKNNKRIIKQHTIGPETMSSKQYQEDPMSDSDDDEVPDIHGSLFMVQQYLYENGYNEALKAMEREWYANNLIWYRSFRSGVKFRPKLIPIGRQMETMVLEYNEERLSKEFSAAHLEEKQTTEFLVWSFRITIYNH